MKTGYGRGYYGNAQLAPSAPQRRTRWFTVAAVVGVAGAAAWFLWPRGSSAGPELSGGGGGGGKDPDPPTPPLPSPPGMAQPAIASAAPSATPPPGAPVTATGGFAKQVEDDARARGFALPSDYEDSVVETAKQLKAAGAEVSLPPHLQHLASRLRS